MNPLGFLRVNNSFLHDVFVNLSVSNLRTRELAQKGGKIQLIIGEPLHHSALSII